MTMDVSDDQIVKVEEWRKLTPKQRFITAASVVGILLLVAGLGFGLGFAAGQNANASTGEAGLTLNVAIAQIDNGAEMTHYSGYVPGDRVNIKLLPDDVAWLLDNVENTLCSPDGLAINAFITQHNLTASKCGPSIHVVLVPPL